MFAARILAAFVLGALAAGCALSENEQEQDPGAAVTDVLEREYSGDYASAWDDLHPRHQRLVTREEYEDCRRGFEVAGAIELVEILGVRDEPLDVYGFRPRTPSKAVEVRVTTGEDEYKASYHVVRLDDRWRWVLSDRAARGFARTDCPA